MDAPKGNIGSANPVFIFLLEHPFFFDQYFYELFRLGARVMPRDRSFHCEVEKSENKDEHGNTLTTVKCHGELVSDSASTLKDQVRPLIPLGGRIVIDLGDVKYLDSSGLGALIGLKVSAINQGLCILEFTNMTSRIMELLRLTHLTQMFSS
jgi:anti-anti-sigma factor